VNDGNVNAGALSPTFKAMVLSFPVIVTQGAFSLGYLKFIYKDKGVIIFRDKTILYLFLVLKI
jgi:hypothetical protein